MNHINGGAMKIAPAAQSKNGYRTVRKSQDKPYGSSKAAPWHPDQRVSITPIGIAALLASDLKSGKKIGGTK